MKVSRARVRPPVVLVVDDFVDNREMYGEYLEHVGFRVLEAADGATAIAVARAERPAVIVMDLSLPGIDGWEATRILKDDPATRDIVIVALTGHAEAMSKARALEAGCDLFVAKPCLPADVAEHVTRALDGAGKTRTNKRR
jgi:CheY-like chemotaxis protein